MNIAFFSSETVFSAELFRKLQSRLADHTLAFWAVGEAAPPHDFEVILGAGNIGREQMASQPRLALIQTLSAGYDGIDIAAASELGIWVSFAPSGPTENAVSVAEFAVFLMIGASRNLNTALASVGDRSMKPSRVNLALTGKTVCIVGLGAIGRLLADRLRIFGMRLVATANHLENAPSDCGTRRRTSRAGRSGQSAPRASGDSHYSTHCRLDRCHARGNGPIRRRGHRWLWDRPEAKVAAQRSAPAAALAARLTSRLDSAACSARQERPKAAIGAMCGGPQKSLAGKATLSLSSIADHLARTHSWCGAMFCGRIS
jgi:hypothetical protein